MAGLDDGWSVIGGADALAAQIVDLAATCETWSREEIELGERKSRELARS